MVLIYILATALLATVNADTCSSSQVNGISTCYQQYMLHYGFNSVLPEYWSFHNVRESWLNNNGSKIQPKICQLGNALLSCVKSNMGCMDAGVYMKMGAANGTEAMDYWIDLAVTQNQCGVNYQVGLDVFYCLAFCRDNHQGQLDQCSTDMGNSIAAGGDPCVATQTFMDCQSAIMTTCCNSNAGAFMCGTNMAGINAANPACASKISCPTGTPSPCSSAAEAQEDDVDVIAEVARVAQQTHRKKL